MQNQYYVYILASKPRGTLYIGVTSNLIRRVWEHKNHCVPGFTKRYDVTHLVYYEIADTAEAAIHREKRLKFWLRGWKIELIEKSNPSWRDLYDEICGVDPAVKPQDDGAGRVRGDKFLELKDSTRKSSSCASSAGSKAVAAKIDPAVKPQDDEIRGDEVVNAS